MITKESHRLKYILINALLLFLLSFMGWLMVMIRFTYTGQFSYRFLLWNLLLAWIPYMISLLIYWINTFKKGHPVILLGLGVLWLLFYPNAPYMITDFIHFQINRSFIIWYDFVIYSLFIWTSFLIGFSSIYLVFRTMRQKLNRIICGFIVIVVLFLSSFGIYLGRFIRWNSWDALFQPIDLMHSALQNISAQSLIFSLIFGTLLTLTYAFLYSITYLRIDEPK